MIESEKVLERKLCKRVKELGGHAYKFVSPNQRGVPDRLCILPNGVTVFVELKTTGKKPTKLQELCMTELRGLGQRCEVIDSSEKLNDLISRIKRGPVVTILGKEIAEPLALAKAYHYEKNAHLSGNALGHVRTRNARKD